jgi:hypothetical protein
MSRRNPPKKVRELFERHNLLVRAEIEELDARHQIQIVRAAAKSPTAFAQAVGAWVEDRWTVSLAHFCVLANGRKTALPMLERLVNDGERQALAVATTALEHLSVRDRDVAVARIGTVLNAHSLRVLSDARLRIYDGSAGSAGTQGINVTDKVVARRRRLVREYCRKHDIKVSGLAQRVGISEESIRAIVREDRGRFSTTGVRHDLLQTLGISVDQWYSE